LGEFLHVFGDFLSSTCGNRVDGESMMPMDFIFAVISAAASTRVIFLQLEHSLLSISGCKFTFLVAVFWQSIEELLKFMQTWGFAISFATRQPGNRSEYIHEEEVLVQVPDSLDPGYVNPPPVFRHWQLVLKYFRYPDSRPFCFPVSTKTPS